VTNYEKLLTDLDARRILLVELTYNNGATTGILRRGQEAWTSGRADTPPDLKFSEGFKSDLNLESGIDRGETLGGVADLERGVLEFPNLDGSFDAWKVGYSVDGYDVRILCVGWLANGTAVGYSEASVTPLFSGVSRGRPSVSYSAMTIAVKGDLYRLDRPLATKLFSPACPHFPGTSAGCVDYGDVLDRGAGSFTVEGWIKTDDPSQAGQLVIAKDTGAAGWYLDLGTAGSGALRFGVREQTPATSDTSTGLIKIGQDHHFAIVWDAAAGKRYIYVDRTLITTTTITAGVPAGNAVSLKIGSSFFGAISRVRVWSTARTLAQIDANMLLPMLGTGVSQETGLEEILSMNENRGTLTYGGMSGSAIVGTLGTGVTWTTSTWCGSSLVGKRWPNVAGKVLDWPLAPIDPSRNIFATSWPPPVSVPAVRSNHNALTLTTQYSVDYRGLVTLVAAPSGTISADIQGETMFNGAISLDGSTGYASGTVTCPAGSMSMGALFRLDAPVTPSAPARVCAWTAGAGAGARTLSVGFGGTNQVRLSVRNDAGTVFMADSPVLTLSRFYALLGVLDTGASAIRLYVDGALVATTAVSGTFATTATAFTIGRNSTTSTEFLPGVVDEVTIWKTALGTSDAEALCVAPAIAGATNLTQCWHCDEGSGSTLTNAVSGGPSLTLAGTYSWTQSRIAPADLINVLATRYAGYGNYSILCDGTTGYASGTVPCPSGSMSLNVWVLASTSTTTHRRIAGWNASGSAGKRQLEFASGSTNLLQWVVINDAGTTFTAAYLATPIQSNVWSSVMAVLDVEGGQIRIYLDGFLATSTSISGTFSTVTSGFALARDSGSAADFLPGGVDEISVWSKALALGDAVTLKNGPVASGAVGLTQCWHCDEGAGRTLTNAVAGGASLAIIGNAIYRVGASPSGMNLTAPMIDMSSGAAFLRQTAADCGWATDDSSTVLETADAILLGLHSYLRPDPSSRKLLMGQVTPQTGTPDALADFSDKDIPAAAEITPADDRLVAPVYKVNIGYARNYNPMPASQLAGVVTSQPDRYQFGQTPWRVAPAQNVSVLDMYSGAREFPTGDPLQSPLLNQSDALTEANRVLPFYGPTMEKDLLDLRTSGLSLTVMSELRVTVLTADAAGRLGMGSPGKSYRVIHAKRVNNRVTAKVWRC